MSETIRESVSTEQGIWCTLETLVRVPGSFHSEWAAPGIGGQCSWGGIRECAPERATFFISNYMSGSDYSGDSVTRANFEVMLEKFSAHVVEMFGGHGTYGIALPLTPWADAEAEREAGEILEGLADYSVIDEEKMSELEMKWSDEAWESWAASHFRKALLARGDVFGTDDDIVAHVEDVLQETPDDTLREFFEKWCDAENRYWETQHSDAYIDVEYIANKIPAEDVRIFWVDQATAQKAARAAAEVQA